jgi:formylglycine-generating enzyme required for sulfatase activity
MQRNVITLTAAIFLLPCCASQQRAADVGQAVPVTFSTIQDCPDCPEMMILPAGSLDMGSDTHDDEKPVHRIMIAKPFAIGKTEVTQDQWKAVMGNNPSYFQNCGGNCPVEQVSWLDAKAFIQKLNTKTAKLYRLPSEAEWEYACRAGTAQEYCGSENVNNVAWYGAYANPKGNSKKMTNPVATKQANSWGLYDMSGNVWEWVEDNFHDNYLDNDNNRNLAPTDGSAWKGDDEMRVIRGGSWGTDKQNIRATSRAGDLPSVRNYDYGFRLVRTLP